MAGVLVVSAVPALPPMATVSGGCAAGAGPAMAAVAAVLATRVSGVLLGAAARPGVGPGAPVGVMSAVCLGIGSTRCRFLQRVLFRVLRIARFNRRMVFPRMVFLPMVFLHMVFLRRVLAVGVVAPFGAVLWVAHTGLIDDEQGEFRSSYLLATEAGLNSVLIVFKIPAHARPIAYTARVHGSRTYSRTIRKCGSCSSKTRNAWPTH